MSKLSRLILACACALSAWPLLPQHLCAESTRATPYLPESYFPNLAKAIEAARQSPQVTEFALLEEEAEARLGQARSHRLPHVNLYLQAGPREEYRSGDVEDNSYFAVNGGVRITQPLYHWGAIKAGIAKARAALDETSLEQLRKETELIRQLRADYLQAILTQQSKAKEEQRLAVLKERLKALRIEVESGKRPEIDVIDLEIQAERAELSIARISNYEATLMDRFHRKSGWTEGAIGNIPLPELSTEPALEWLRAEEATLETGRAFDWIPVQKQMAEIRQHDAQIEIIEANNRPKINLFLAATQGVTNTATDNDVNTVALTGGIGVTWNIFDGFLTQEQKIEAHLKKTRLKYQLDRQVAELRSEQRRMLEVLHLRLRELELLSRSRPIREAQYKEAEIARDAGRMTKADFQQAELQLENFEIELSQARVDVLLGMSDYNSFIQMAETD